MIRNSLRCACAVGVLLIATQARSASFDCQQARQPGERLICAHPALSSLDDQLALAYRQQASGLSAPASASALASQRNWLAFWPQSCSTTPRRVTFDASALQCAVLAYQSRLQHLQARSPLPGERLYDVSVFAALPTAPDSSRPLATHRLSYPQFDVPTPDAPAAARLRAINAWLRQDAARWRAGLNNDSDSERDTRLVAIGDMLLTATDQEEMNGHGSAHPNTALNTRHYLIEAGRELTATDLFTGNAWIRIAAAHAHDQLSRQLGQNLQTGSGADLRRLIADPGHWAFSATGLTLEFGRGEVASYADGFQEAVVPWSLLMPHLTPVGMRIVETLARQGSKTKPASGRS